MSLAISLGVKPSAGKSDTEPERNFGEERLRHAARLVAVVHAHNAEDADDAMLRTPRGVRRRARGDAEGMRTRQLSDLQADVRKRADIEGSTAFIPDAEITEYINQVMGPHRHGQFAHRGELLPRRRRSPRSTAGQQYVN